MLVLVLALIIIILGIGSYNRYVPIRKIPCNKTGFHEPDTIILDIRDYNVKGNVIKNEALNIPYAYLKRYRSDISQGNIHVIASNRIEVNLGIRFLIRKGFHVRSYELTNESCEDHRRLDYGIR